MGFYINEFENDLKQHINLSSTAWSTIYDDLNSLNMKVTTETFSGFLNKVFFNYYQSANATISLRNQEYKEKLTKTLEAGKFPSKDKVIIEQCIEMLSHSYINELQKTARSFPKGQGKKFRVNKQNIEILLSSADSEYYNDSIGLYFKAILEEYAQKQPYEREQIYYKDIFDTVSSAIFQSVRVKTLVIQNKPDKTIIRTFYVSPYKIVPDNLGMHNYLVGVWRELTEKGELGPKLYRSVRITKIKKVALVRSMPSFISREDQTDIDEQIAERSPQFFSSDVIDVKVRFKKSGMMKMFKTKYMRPTKYEKLDDTTYLFHCTRRQAEEYFFRFGSDIQILEPMDLRKKFIGWYKYAYVRYQELATENTSSKSKTVDSTASQPET